MSLVLRLFSLACIALVIAAPPMKDFLHNVGDRITLPDNPTVQQWINAVKVVYSVITRRQMAIGDIFGTALRDVCRKAQWQSKVHRGCKLVIGFEPLEKEIEDKKSLIENLLFSIGTAVVHIGDLQLKEIPVGVVLTVCTNLQWYFGQYANGPKAKPLETGCQQILSLTGGNANSVVGALGSHNWQPGTSVHGNQQGDPSLQVYLGHGTSGHGTVGAGASGSGNREDNTWPQLSLWHGTAETGASGSDNDDVDTSLHL